MITYSACGSNMMRVSILSKETLPVQLLSSLSSQTLTQLLVLDITKSIKSDFCMCYLDEDRNQNGKNLDIRVT